jgi:hypothetical protein
MRAETAFFADDGAPCRADYLVSRLSMIPHVPERDVVLLDEVSRGTMASPNPPAPCRDGLSCPG